MPAPVTKPDTDTEIGKQILGKVFQLLGKPRDLSAQSKSYTRATRVTSNSWRIMIFRDLPYPKLTDTFFVRTDDEGRIVQADPQITQKYGV